LPRSTSRPDSEVAAHQDRKHGWISQHRRGRRCTANSRTGRCLKYPGRANMLCPTSDRRSGPRRRHSGTSSNVRVSRWSRDRSSRLTFQLSSNDRHQSTRWAWHVWRCRLICRTNVLPRRRPAARPSRSDQDAARAPPTGGVGQQSPETGRRARSAFEGARSPGPAGE
jgi:hypothetical protein